MSESSAPPRAEIDKRKSIVLGLIGLVVIVLIFWKVIPQIGSYSEAWDSLKGMRASSIVVIAAAVLLYLVFYGLPYYAAAPGLHFLRAQQVNQAAFAIGNGLPAGGAVGLAVQFGMLTSFGIAAAAATAAITAVGLWSTFVTLGAPVLGVGALAVSGNGAGSHVTVALIGGGVLIAAVLLFILIVRSEPLARKVGELGNTLLTPFRRWDKLRNVDVVGPILSFRTSMHDLLVRRWAPLTAAQVGVLITQFLILFAALHGIQQADGKHSSVFVAFAAFGIAQLGLMIPITPGGLGTVDAAMIALMVSMGIDNADAVAAALVWRAVSFVPQISIGIIALVTWYRKANQLVGTSQQHA